MLFVDIKSTQTLENYVVLFTLSIDNEPVDGSS